MPRNGTGTYSLPQSPFVAGTVISSAAVNSDFSDIAAALTASLPRDGQAGMSAVLPLSSTGFHYITDVNSGMRSTATSAQAISCGGVDVVQLTSTTLVFTGALNVVGVISNNGTPVFPLPTAALADASVTYAKIQNVGASRIFGNPTGAPAVGSEISLGAGMSFVGTTLVSTINPALVPGYLSGLTLSTAGSSATFSVAAGVANDTASGGLMTGSALSKTTGSWVVGNNNGGLDVTSPAIANSTWYHVYLIKRPDTGVVDIAISTNATAPLLIPTANAVIPAAYTLSRRIGSMKTNGSAQWTSFTQVGDQFIWAAPVQDVTNAGGAASRSTPTLTVPLGIVVNALFRANMGSIGAVSAQLMLPSLLETDASVTALNADLNTFNGNAAGAFARLTNTSQQIGYRSANTNTGNICISTYGWVDTRGQ